jgi:stage V sporulation protein SpoVS
MIEENNIVLRVTNTAHVGKLANAIWHQYKNSNGARIVVRSMGASSLNQAVKAIIVTSKLAIKSGFILSIYPSFSTFYYEEEQKEKTAIDLVLKFARPN